MSRSESGPDPSWDTNADRVGGGLVALLIVLSWGRLELLSNEPIYLLGPLRLLQPDVLAADWTLGGDPWASPAVLFRILVAPLWAFFEDATQLALVARGICWLALVIGLRSWARAAGLDPRPFWAGVLLYLLARHNLAAGEWLLGGAEQKVAAYAALLFALAALSKGKWVRGGMLAGLAVAFHVLVGGWAGVGIGIALLAARPPVGISGLLRFAAAALIVSAPILAISFSYLLGGGDAIAVDPDAISLHTILVELRNPHHLDPSHFLRGRHLWIFPLVVTGALVGAHRLPSRAAARLMTVFLLILTGLYGVGLAAHFLGLTSLAILYPFRVGDAFLPLFFWVLLPNAAWVSWARWRTTGFSRGEQGLIVAMTIGTVLLFARETDRMPKRIARTLSSWSESSQLARAQQRAVWRRIQSETPPDAVFAAPPCEPRFWIEARRARVAGWKSAPSNARAREWYARMVALNGGHEFQARGSEICEALALEFARLDRASLAHLRDGFGASHYLVETQRPDLQNALVFGESGGWVYALDRVGRRD